MNSSSIIAKKIYNEKLAKYGYNEKALGWLNGRQEIRFSALTSIGNLQNSNVCDMGCGFGDLYNFLINNKKIKFHYTGLDINENFLQFAQKHIKRANARFIQFDLREDKMIEKYDWIFSSGVFNHKKTTDYQFIKNSIKKMFTACNKGIAIDFMSSYVDFKNKNIFYSQPETIFKLCKSVTKRITLRSDYMPFEFCIYLYKNDSKTESNVFTEFAEALTKTKRKKLQ